MFVRLGKILFKATRDRLRNEIAFWQVSYVCGVAEKEFTGPEKANEAGVHVPEVEF